MIVVALKLITPPANDPISLQEAKDHLRIAHSDDDDLIEAFITAATKHVDGPRGYLGRALIEQTWDYYADAFPLCNKPLEIPLPPLLEIIGVFYLDSSGGEQEFSAAAYTIDYASEPARLWLPSSGSWPSSVAKTNAVRVRFRAGYLDESVSPAVDDVPADIRHAILLYIGSMYEYREQIVSSPTPGLLPWGAEQLLRNHRAHLGFA